VGEEPGAIQRRVLPARGHKGHAVSANRGVGEPAGVVRGRYRANIVAYTIAKFSHLILFESVGKLLDFKKIWNRQALGPALERQLILIAEQMFAIIVSPQSGFQNSRSVKKRSVGPVLGTSKFRLSRSRA